MLHTVVAKGSVRLCLLFFALYAIGTILGTT